MSLVSLAHVCSHLQNASLARLGVTSIPYTRLHLSFALLLHKQGFISQLKLAGPSPPLSLFPAGVRDDLVPARLKRRKTDPRSTIQSPAVPDVQFSDAELEFLLSHYQKSREDLEKIFDPVEQDQEGADEQTQAPVDLSQKEHYIDLVERNRRLVAEAHLLVGERDGNTDAVGLELARVLQSSPDPTAKAEEPVPQLEDDLDQEGIVTQSNRASRRLWLGMKYWDGMPVMSKAQMVSKPTKRIKLDERELAQVVRGRTAATVRPLNHIGEIMAVKTAMGVLEARECVERKIGGMVLCRVW